MYSTAAPVGTYRMGVCSQGDAIKVNSPMWARKMRAEQELGPHQCVLMNSRIHSAFSGCRSMRYAPRIQKPLTSPASR